ncbi:MAG: ribonuclease T [Flavobacteriales bacterium]|jgi:ribonuclease T
MDFMSALEEPIIDDLPPLARRFRKFLPVVIDVETGGFQSSTDALLEVGAVTLTMDELGILAPEQCLEFAIEPFEGANIEKSALDFTGIDIDDPERGAVSEATALKEIFKAVRSGVKEHGCNRAILVGHNAHFDLGFMMAAVNRNSQKRNPFHPFSCFDTASLSGLVYGQTVLAKACEAAKIEFSNKEAHSAGYDALRTAELFCAIVNRWKEMGGWKG